MNAYELADELAECIIDGSTDLVCVAQAATMLRQQADRIAELEKILEQEGIGIGSDLLNGGIAIVKKIQTKPLSDEEMKELINNFPIIFSPQDLLTFARAIEERHGIK